MTVTIPVGGTSATSGADQFTYDAVPATVGAPSLQMSGSNLILSWVVPADNGSAITGFVLTLLAGGVAQSPVQVPARALGNTLNPTPGATDSYTFSGLTPESATRQRSRP